MLKTSFGSSELAIIQAEWIFQHFTAFKRVEFKNDRRDYREIKAFIRPKTVKTIWNSPRNLQRWTLKVERHHFRRFRPFRINPEVREASQWLSTRDHRSALVGETR